MSIDDFERFATDLQMHAGLSVEFIPSEIPNGMHVLNIAGVDFYFKVGGGYDGWGAAFPTARTTGTAARRANNRN